MSDLHPLIEQLVTRHRASALNEADVERFCATPNVCLLVFTEDPLRYREVLDLVVIAPEIARAFPGTFTVGVLYPEAARVVGPRFGVRRWPALVLTRDGGCVGSIEGLRSWDDYLREIATLLEAPVKRAPVPMSLARSQPMQGDAA